ncbi:MAG: coproporphyrinogen dehydrogenase HemZ [Eubacteriales bacterium]|nr:coproporphyrinogen dehydrogenase HemZ [Eubacteriales bacterium]
MKVFIDNNTGYLNDYHFKSLCLLYFPAEKFPEQDSSSCSVSFTLNKTANGLRASASVVSPYGNSSAECGEEDIIFTIPTAGEDIAAAVTGKAFLKAGEKLFGFLPPWGYLTGLRPVKRARYYLERGFRENKVRRLFENDYNVSSEKTSLSVRTAYSEIKLLSSITPKNCGVYVSVPFCPTRCDYCSFVSYSNNKLFRLIPEYLERLANDIKRTGSIIKETGFVPVSVYIGGGTPSFLSEEQLRFLLCAINKYIPMDSVREYSFEGGRPDTLTAQKLGIIKNGGVNRISVNPQSTCQRVLDAIGRKHTVEDFFKAASLAMKCGFSTVNTDLIAGLPEDTFDTFSKTLDDVINIGFENITVHTLSIKNASEIKNEYGAFDPVGRLARECVSYAGNTLTERGYDPYYLYRQKRTVGNGENTGFSLCGHESIYNVMMMEESSTVFACGAGAITKLVSVDGTRIERIAFPKYPFEYLERDDGIGEDRIHLFLLKG